VAIRRCSPPFGKFRYHGVTTNQGVGGCEHQRSVGYTIRSSGFPVSLFWVKSGVSPERQLIEGRHEVFAFSGGVE
jgi:hypothetical protein